MFATFGTIVVITACAVDNGFMAATSGMVAGSGGASGQVTGSGGYVGPVKTFALTPPMGWNSWNKFQGGVSDAVIRQIADAMVTSGMKAAGYQYVVIDDTWQMTRDASGNIVPDPARFPDMKALADYVHGQGLKFGLYSDRGSKTCAGRPGSQDHETQDAQTYAAWGVDYLKYDNCNADAATLQQGYQKMGNALTATGRDIVYSICAWWYYDWAVQVGHLQRTTTDIQDNWLSVSRRQPGGVHRLQSGPPRGGVLPVDRGRRGPGPLERSRHARGRKRRHDQRRVPRALQHVGDDGRAADRRQRSA